MLTIRRIALVVALAVVCTWSSSAMARWGIALDAPLFYQFNNAEVNQQSGPNNTPVDWSNAENPWVSGFILAIYTPLNIYHAVYFGLGVDEYSVAGDVAIPQGNGGGGPTSVKTKTDLEIYNLILDIPTELFNFGLGYGMGNAKTTIIFPGFFDVPLSSTNVTQKFVSFGAVFGRFDLHLSYRWVDVDNAVIPNIGGGGGNNPPDFFLASGRLTTLGARVNF